MKKRILKNIEWGILICTVLLIGIGMVALYSATQSSGFDELKKQAEKIATENNISEEDFIKKCQALFSEITDDNLDDAQKERRVYRRFIGSLRKQSSQDCEKFTGYVFAREKNKDFADIRRKKITEYLEDHSIEEAKEIKYVNDDGEYLIAYDPLDGSSLVDVNLSVGSIYGIYKNEFNGQNLVASVYVVFGPRVEMVVTIDDVKMYRLRHGKFEFISYIIYNFLMVFY